MMKKNWKLWHLLWKFLKKHKNAYFYYKKTNDIDYLYTLADEFSQELLNYYHIKVEVSYDDLSFKEQQVLFVANHQSMFDPLFIFQYLNHPCGFFIAGEFDRYLKYQALRIILEASKSVYIYRNDIRKTALEIKKASEYVKTSNTSYMIFPEGHIKCEGKNITTCDAFLPGAFKIAKNNNLMIVPITILDSEKIHHTTNYLDMLAPGIIHIHFHKPITAQQYQDLNTQQISEMVRNIIIKDLENKE